MASIKPCPFCGSFDTRMVSFGNEKVQEISVRCNSCNAIGPVVISPPSNEKVDIQKAVNMWNDRIE